jgi:hypothetical protein
VSGGREGCCVSPESQVLFEHAHDAAVHGFGEARWDLGAWQASVTALKRSTMRLAKSCSRLGSLRCVVCIRRMVSKRAGMPTHELRVNTQASAAVGGWAEVEVFSASRRGPLHSSTPSFALGSFLPAGCQPRRVGLVLAMSFERTGCLCADPLSPASAHILVAHCWLGPCRVRLRSGGGPGP